MRAQGTLIISPHADDAALSIGGILSKKILEEPVTLITVFGRSNYSRGLLFQNDWETVTAKRRQEDAAFADSLGLRRRYLDFPEAGLRYGPYFDQIFSGEIEADAEILDELDAIIGPLIDLESPGFLFVPLGLGRHRDHLIVNSWARRVSTRSLPTVIYYEDLPYAALLSETEIFRAVSSVCSTPTPTFVSIDRELPSKLDRLMIYQTQIGELESEAVKYYAGHWERNRYFERVWAASAFTPNTL